MRSQVLFRRSRSLLKGPAACRPALFSAARPDSLLKRFKPSLPAANDVVVRLLSSSTGSDSTHSDVDVQPVPNTLETPTDEPEKPKRRSKVLAATKELEPLPDELDILWTPDVNPSDLNPSHSSALPPPEILEEALNNLHIILHPQTQHRAIYTSPAGPPTEPTFALFCPIEGGEYIIDATVRELACRTGSEVVILDAVQLAAGEWGTFGKAANSLQLPRNPLHFPSYVPLHSQPTRPVLMDEDDEGEVVPQMITPSQMTLAVMTPLPMQGRALMTPSPRRNPSPSKVKIFFDELINISNKLPILSETQSPPIPTKPRIIYIRDFPTLAPTSASWYPPLLSAVRQRRQGPLSRPTSPINNPMAIIFGMTSPLTPPIHLSSNQNGGTVSNFMNDSQPSSPSVLNSKSTKSEWSEDNESDKAREKRLRDRLRTWERSDKALLDELPTLSGSSELDRSPRPEILVIGGPGIMSALPPIPGAGTIGSPGNRHGMPGPGTNSKFFRTSILIPNNRSLATERACRVGRRREINELTMRMGVGAVGGILGEKSVTVQQSGDELGSKDQSAMWEDWGERVEEWSTVRRIADRAVGSVVAASTLAGLSVKSTLDPTAIPWSAICRAWSAQKLSLDMRKAWTKQTAEMTSQEEDDTESTTQHEIDEVVERVKHDPDLDQHEHRLLSCIIDPASMPTTFSQVHLPSHTIDSVRTIVSLPLLHPSAFQQGILKTHGMNGLLLFGPPGTGKTLIVRALAKEAGCRMMAVNPSDVLDMYLGEGEKLVKAVFSLARRLSPCVVFLDEIDTLFGARMSAQSAGAFAHRGVITEFMQEMDGLKSSKDNRVVVIGATNRPFDLDDAVLRRLPRRLLVDLPGPTERQEILKILLRDEVLAPDVNLKVLAKKTATFSGSDLKHLCVSAALDAVKEHMEVPWNTQVAPVELDTPNGCNAALTSTAPENLESSASATLQHPATTSDQASNRRVLSLHHFSKALKEIVPSSSESLSSLTDLRKWNDEFGEGRNSRKSQQVWGRGRFGFIDYDERKEEGKVEMVDKGSSRTGAGP